MDAPQALVLGHLPCEKDETGIARAVSLGVVCGIFSVFSLSPQTEGVTITGAKYELHDAILTSHTPLGVSNELIGVQVDLSLRKGCLLLVWEDEEADADKLALQKNEKEI